jgi:hypothetical protein
MDMFFTGACVRAREGGRQAEAGKLSRPRDPPAAVSGRLWGGCAGCGDQQADACGMTVNNKRGAAQLGRPSVPSDKQLTPVE